MMLIIDLELYIFEFIHEISLTANLDVTLDGQ